MKENFSVVEIPKMCCPGCGEDQLASVWVTGKGNNHFGKMCGNCKNVYVPYYNKGQFGLRPAALTENVHLVGVTEAAEILGWPKGKVSTYRKRGKMPEPVAVLKGGPVWLKEDIIKFKGEEYVKKSSEFYEDDNDEQAASKKEEKQMTHEEMMDRAWRFIEEVGITEDKAAYQKDDTLILVDDVHKVRDAYYNDLENGVNDENEDVYGFLDRHGIKWQ